MDQQLNEAAARQLLEVIVETFYVHGTLTPLDDFTVALLEHNIRSRANSFTSDYDSALFGTAFARLVENDESIPAEDKELIMDALITSMTGDPFIHINVINKTTGAHYEWLTNPTVTFKDTLNAHGGARNLRFFFKGKTIFVSSCAKKTMRELGFNEGDTLIMEEIPASVSLDSKREITRQQDLTTLNTGDVKNSRAAPSKSNRTCIFRPSTMTMEDYRLQHSIKLSKVFEEAYPIFKGIKQKLNADLLHRSAPKERTANHQQRESQVISDITSGIAGLDLGCAKAGKAVYYVLVGDPDKLHCSRKKYQTWNKPIAVIDLHGRSSIEAIQRLESCLPKLMEEAMIDDPWVIPVNIVWGCGRQTLAAVVENWIKRQSTVANRPKSFGF
jgi:hypothetical protein